MRGSLFYCGHLRKHELDTHVVSKTVIFVVGLALFKLCYPYIDVLMHLFVNVLMY